MDTVLPSYSQSRNRQHLHQDQARTLQANPNNFVPVPTWRSQHSMAPKVALSLPRAAPGSKKQILGLICAVLLSFCTVHTGQVRHQVPTAWLCPAKLLLVTHLDCPLLASVPESPGEGHLTCAPSALHDHLSLHTQQCPESSDT